MIEENLLNTNEDIFITDDDIKEDDMKNPNVLFNISFLAHIQDYKNNSLHIGQNKYSYPEGTLNYETFVALYYLIFQTILHFSEKARYEGLLALEDEIGAMGDEIFHKGLRLVIDGTDASVIRNIFLTYIERENNQYQKKLKMFTLEGILAIQAGESTSSLMIRLKSMIFIKDNLFDKACAAYLNGDEKAYKKAMEAIGKIKLPEEREEVNFILRAIKFSETISRSGFKAIEKMLDANALASRDILEYGLRLYLDCEQEEYINQILDNFISCETDPDRKNLCLAKKKAFDCILAGDNFRILTMSLMAYFDEHIEKLVLKTLRPKMR
jgi:flagellar motor component MotA